MLTKKELSKYYYLSLEIKDLEERKRMLEQTSIGSAKLTGMPKAQVASRVIMAPEHAKRLLLALQDNIQKYESQFGQIKIQQAPKEGSTIAPFNIKKGEA